MREEAAEAKRVEGERMVKELRQTAGVYRVDMTVKVINTQTAEVVGSEDKWVVSKPGEQTSHVQLLQGLVATLSFSAPAFPAVASPPPAQGKPRVRAWGDAY